MGNRAAPILMVLAGALALGACVDEDVVFDDRPIYQRIAALAGGFVGYADPSNDDKLTVCGTCHGEYQEQWQGTAHADAWAGLQESGHAQEFCEACHTVNSLGNIALEGEGGEATGGHAADLGQHGRYLDVQCESCHGPGLEHVLSPRPGNIPLAPITVGIDLSSGCGECHQGIHHPFVDEWEISPHGNVSFFAAEDEENGCYSCHSGEGGLERFGVTEDYLEKDELVGSDHYAEITCAVCHDPHSAANEGQLRAPVNTTDTGEHLCAVCHDFRPRPDTRPQQAYLRTHEPSAGLMDGAAGWFPPGSGLEPGSVTHPHGSADRLCASCHVVAYTATDELTGEEFTAEGHTFLAAPCVDASGRPTGNTSCALTAEARDFQGCLECHDSEEEAASALRASVSALLPKVRTLLNRLTQIDPNLAARGGEIDANDFRFTVAEGAYFTYTVAVHADGLPAQDDPARRALAAAVAHNPALMDALVDAALDALDAEYGA